MGIVAEFEDSLSNIIDEDLDGVPTKEIERYFANQTIVQIIKMYRTMTEKMMNDFLKEE